MSKREVYIAIRITKSPVSEQTDIQCVGITLEQSDLHKLVRRQLQAGIPPNRTCGIMINTDGQVCLWNYAVLHDYDEMYKLIFAGDKQSYEQAYRNLAADYMHRLEELNRVDVPVQAVCLNNAVLVME